MVEKKILRVDNDLTEQKMGEAQQMWIF